ncbi:unannotated protein [freshwater metagenome]|uniref:Unannotated protein n=1 Tax=freshwater metagenome TaxID=449393 RepID=A0A6J6ZL15_9ZZZZ
MQRGHLLIELSVLVLGLLDRRSAPRHGLLAQTDQPLAQCQCGSHVILVVRGDPCQRLVVRHVHEALVLHDGAGTRVDVVTAFVPGEPLHVLEPVRLDASDHAVAHHLQQVNEQSSLNELSQQHLIRAVVGG